MVRAIFAVVLLILTIRVQGSSDVQRVIPFDAPWARQPLWVARTFAFEDGKLKLSLFAPETGRDLMRYARRQALESASEATRKGREPQCSSHYVERPIGDLPALSTLRELFDDALGVYSGTVRSVAEGFFDGQPASLLEIEVTSELKASDKYASTKILWVHYPMASFAAEGAMWCARPLEHDREVHVNDRVIVFARHLPLDSERRIIPAGSGDLIFESGGTLIYPRKLRADPAASSLRSLTDVIRDLRRRRDDSQVK